MPNFVNINRNGVLFQMQRAGVAHPHDVLPNPFMHSYHFCIDRHDVSLLRLAAQCIDIDLDFSKYFGAGEGANVVQVAGIVSRLQANEVDLGLTRKALCIEVDRQVTAHLTGIAHVRLEGFAVQLRAIDACRLRRCAP